MIIVIFEFEPKELAQSRYFELAQLLLDEVKQIDGFISVERFQSVANSCLLYTSPSPRD